MQRPGKRSYWLDGQALQLTTVDDPLSDPDKFERQCAGKERYPSESAASAALKALRKEKLLRRAETMRVYQCDFVTDEPHFHFGH